MTRVRVHTLTPSLLEYSSLYLGYRICLQQLEQFAYLKTRKEGSILTSLNKPIVGHLCLC